MSGGFHIRRNSGEILDLVLVPDLNSAVMRILLLSSR